MATDTRLVAHLDWRPTSKEDGPNAHVSAWARAKRTNLVATIIAVALREAGWPRGWGRSGAGLTMRFTVSQKIGPFPDDDNMRGMLKDARDAVCQYLGLATAVVRRRGRSAGTGWSRARDDAAGGVRFEYEWRRGPDGMIIEVEEAATT